MLTEHDILRIRDEHRYAVLRRRAAIDRRTTNNGRRLKMEAVDQARRATRDAELDAILAADNDDLDAELAHLTAE